MQSDAMVSVRDGAFWSEHTAGIGFVERNPVFQDGLAGSQVAVTVDSQGRIHAAYQFNYEGCDAMNFRYPDLLYVRLDPATLDGSVVEEVVEGNDYEDANEQNNVGGHVVITVDGSDNPVVFYYAELTDGTQGLRLARRTNDTWQQEWVETGCEVGHISATRAEADGQLGVAYYVERYTDGRDDVHCLRYAAEGPTGWTVEMVDDTSRCGDHCALAFDDSGLPLIAYREIESHTGYSRKNLKMARFDGTSWERDVVSSTGDIGHFNSVWADDQGRIVIFSYSNSDQTIYSFQK
jgi:hypothetical protein